MGIIPSESNLTCVRKILFAEVKEAAASLAECFTNDRVAHYYLQISDSDRPLNPREAILYLRSYECLTAAHCHSGLMISAGRSHESVGRWLPPGCDCTWRTYWRSRMCSLWLWLGREGRTRFFGSWETLEALWEREF